MKNLFILLAIIIVAMLMSLSGCQSSEQSTSKIDSNVQTDISVSKVINAQKSLSLKVDSLFYQVSSFQKFINELEQKKESESKQETEYDTSKPIVPETGKPPVSKEIVYNKNTESSKQFSSAEINNISTQIQKKIEARFDSLYKGKFDSLASENKKIKADIADITKTGRSFLGSIYAWFTSLCLVFFILLAIYLGLKYKSKIIAFFGKLFFKI